MESALRTLGVYRLYEGRLRSQIEKDDMPSHIGIILDGNRRWAASQGVSEGFGHMEGANRAEELLDWCHELGIKTVTLYVLSTENLDRPSTELKELFELIQARLARLLTDERITRYKVRSGPSDTWIFFRNRLEIFWLPSRPRLQHSTTTT